MKQKRNIKIFIFCCFVLFSVHTYAQERLCFEFIDQKISDIIFALSNFSGYSMLTDETVEGNASFQYTGESFDEAFLVFLKANRLYGNWDGNTCTVSKISISKKNDNSILLDVFDSSIDKIFEKLSMYIGQAILFSTLPQTKISIHIQSANPQELIEMVLKTFPGYSVKPYKNNFLISQNIQPNTHEPIQTSFSITKHNALYSCNIYQIKASEVFAKLCVEEGMSFLNVLKHDPLVFGIHLIDVEFEVLLEAVLLQAQAESFIEKGIRYFVPSKITDSGKRAFAIQEIWEIYPVKHLDLHTTQKILVSRFKDIHLVLLDNNHAIAIKTTIDQIQTIKDFIQCIDVPTQVALIQLKYITCSELLKNLPPSITEKNIYHSGSENAVFFVGTEEVKKRFLQDIAQIDMPKERIRYDMLIIQYDKTKNTSWKSNLFFRKMEFGDMTATSGNFSNLVHLNFDVISVFGYFFSNSLEASLAENSAKVFTDTTVHALTGETVQFKNTSTYRYRDTAIDPDTGKPVYTGVTREINSGIVLEIQGHISGEKIVTMNVRASVSKRGSDVSSTTGNPPPTSEKSIETKLSTKNGEPVILSGLKQNDESITEGKLPFISKIPIIKHVFKQRYDTKSNSEMVIYLVPHISNGLDADKEIKNLLSTAFFRLVKTNEDANDAAG